MLRTVKKKRHRGTDVGEHREFRRIHVHSPVVTFNLCSVRPFRQRVSNVTVQDETNHLKSMQRVPENVTWLKQCLFSCKKRLFGILFVSFSLDS